MHRIALVVLVPLAACGFSETRVDVGWSNGSPGFDGSGASGRGFEYIGGMPEATTSGVAIDGHDVLVGLGGVTCLFDGVTGEMDVDDDVGDGDDEVLGAAGGLVAVRAGGTGFIVQSSRLGWSTTGRFDAQDVVAATPSGGGVLTVRDVDDGCEVAWTDDPAEIVIDRACPEGMVLEPDRAVLAGSPILEVTRAGVRDLGVSGELFGIDGATGHLWTSEPGSHRLVDTATGDQVLLRYAVEDLQGYDAGIAVLASQSWHRDVYLVRGGEPALALESGSEANRLSLSADGQALVLHGGFGLDLFRARAF